VLAHPAVVEMPETAVDEDDFAAAGEDEIGVAREFPALCFCLGSWTCSSCAAPESACPPSFKSRAGARPWCRAAAAGRGSEVGRGRSGVLEAGRGTAGR
jgi:hypothetical protein